MLSELTNHVWQSTIFAILVGLMTVAFRRNGAQVRYGLWFIASCKSLVPLSILISFGRCLEWIPALHRTAPAKVVQFTFLEISQPFPRVMTRAPVAAARHDWVGIAVFSIWALGFAAVILIRFRDWFRIRAAIRSSTQLPMQGTVEVRSSPGLLEPGIVGLFRPTLLLPAGIKERLEEAEFTAVLAHELCHVRRRDNLTSAVHMLVEAVFWFHPLVWWIGARLVEERERACDEAVLSLGNKPRDYAEGILKVCKSYLESPLSCMSGVTGSDMKKRIQAILMGRAVSRLTLSKKAALAIAAVTAVIVPIVIGAFDVSRVEAEPQQPRQEFESASIKRCEVFDRGNYQVLTGTNFRSECTTLERLAEQAYGLFANGRMDAGSFLTVSGGPAWTTSDLYQVDAKTNGPEGRALMNGPMLQALLEDRFELKFHREIRQLPVYDLTVAEGGPRLQPFEGTCITRDFDKLPSDADCGTARAWRNGFRLHAATMADLCAGFSVLLDRHVADKTGIAGKFDIDVDLSEAPPELLNRPRALHAMSDPINSPSPPVLFSAAQSAMNKVGLNLEPAEGPGEFLVIDHVERPSGN